MISVAECAALAGLTPNEIILGVSPSAKHGSLLSSYLLNSARGPMAVRDMIIGDLRRFRELGALQRTADLLLVLRVFLTRYPDAMRTEKHEDEFRASKSGSGGERSEAGTAETRGKLIELPRRNPHRAPNLDPLRYHAEFPQKRGVISIPAILRHRER